MSAGGLEPLAGGWSGETFLSRTGGEPVVVRIYGARSASRGPLAAEIDAAVLRLVRGLVPVPEVLEVRRGEPDTDTPALLVSAFVEGVRGDELLANLDAAGRATLGARVGTLAATLAGMPMLRGGVFTDGELSIAAYAGLADGLPGWVEEHEPRLAGWSQLELSGLRSVAEEAQALLDTVQRVSLVHSDLNPKNLLVDPVSLEVTALLDWEFAHAGHPFTDLGNAVRFEREPEWVAAAVSAYVDLRGGCVEDALDLARAADLVALVELAARSGDSPVADRADRLLRAIAASGDRHAQP